MKLTKPQKRNLEHVRDFGKPIPRNCTAYHCRIKGLSEFVWLLSDGTTATNSDVRAMPVPMPEERCLVKTIGEQLTDAGRAALSQEGE